MKTVVIVSLIVLIGLTNGCLKKTVDAEEIERVKRDVLVELCIMEIPNSRLEDIGIIIPPEENQYICILSDPYMDLPTLKKDKIITLVSDVKVTAVEGEKSKVDLTKPIEYISDIKTDEEKGTPEFIKDVRKIGTVLEVTPTISPDQLITLDMYFSVRKLIERKNMFEGVPKDMGWPVIDERSMRTGIKIRSGETVVLGGMVNKEKSSHTLGFLTATIIE